MQHFDHLFLSFETGHMKPDNRAFRHVIDQLSRPPEQILFFDDNPHNVEAARNAGMHAETVDSPATVEALLIERDLFNL